MPLTAPLSERDVCVDWNGRLAIPSKVRSGLTLAAWLGISKRRHREGAVNGTPLGGGFMG